MLCQKKKKKKKKKKRRKKKEEKSVRWTKKKCEAVISVYCLGENT